MKEIKIKVIKYSDIPKELTKDQWFSTEYPNECCYVEGHIDISKETDELDKWFMKNYPGIENEESFLIEIDY